LKKEFARVLVLGLSTLVSLMVCAVGNMTQAATARVNTSCFSVGNYSAAHYLQSNPLHYEHDEDINNGSRDGHTDDGQANKTDPNEKPGHPPNEEDDD
jgi:hypothetical protein